MIDFEQRPKNAHQNFLTFLLELHAAFAPRGWLLAITAPAAATDYQRSQ